MIGFRNRSNPLIGGAIIELMKVMYLFALAVQIECAQHTPVKTRRPILMSGFLR